MQVALLQALGIVIRSAAVAAGILLVGGAIKKVVQDPPDECLEQGMRLAGLVTTASRALPSGALPRLPNA
jgi:hypothetical protein